MSGEITSDDWAERIVKHVVSVDPDIDPVFLQDYGMDEEQAIEVYDRLFGSDDSVSMKDAASFSPHVKLDGDVL